MNPSRYRTKIDVWVLAVLIGAFVFTLLDWLFFLVFWRGVLIERLIVVLLIPLIWGGILSLLIPTYYEITSSTLFVRSGWLRYRIPLASIQRVFPTHNPLSAPALSLDRLQIEYMQGNRLQSQLISPQDKPGFLQDLARHAGDLHWQGDQLIRL